MYLQLFSNLHSGDAEFGPKPIVLYSSTPLQKSGSHIQYFASNWGSALNDMCFGFIADPPPPPLPPSPPPQPPSPTAQGLCTLPGMSFVSGGPLFGTISACVASSSTSDDVSIYSPSNAYRMSAQSDQNLVLYDSKGNSKWASNTRNSGASTGVQLAMQQVGFYNNTYQTTKNNKWN